MSFMRTLNLNDCLYAESECKQRLPYHGKALTKHWGAPSHSSWQLRTPSSYTKQVGLPIFSCPQRAADADRVCNAPETTQWAGSGLNRYLYSPILMHECAGLSLALNTSCSMQVPGCELATGKPCPHRESCSRWFKFP